MTKYQARRIVALAFLAAAIPWLFVVARAMADTPAPTGVTASDAGAGSVQLGWDFATTADVDSWSFDCYGDSAGEDSGTVPNDGSVGGGGTVTAFANGFSSGDTVHCSVKSTLSGVDSVWTDAPDTVMGGGDSGGGGGCGISLPCWLNRCWCAIKSIPTGIANLAVSIVNVTIQAVATMVGGLLGLLPDMPDAAGGLDNGVLGAINWVFPVGGLAAVLATAIACWLTWLGLSWVLRAVRFL